MASVATIVYAGKSLATPAISFLVNKAFTYLDEHWKTDAADDLKCRILQALPRIQAVFDVINPERIKEDSSALDAWLWQLRDAVEEAEDALDEIEYYELKEKAKDRKVSDWGSPFDKMKHKAIMSVKCSSVVDNAAKGLEHPGTIQRLRRSVEGLEKSAKGVVDFLALTDYLRGHSSQQDEGFLNKYRETSSMLTANEVFGRQDEMKLLVEMLTKTSDEDTEIAVSSSSHVSIVSIIGHGGMGKTTLAQLICQDGIIRNHFNMVIWSCVSTSFDAKTITSKILESATSATPGASTLDALQKAVEENLKSVKFLLILDDVWEDQNFEQWEKLFAPLRKGKSGSKILLTTRMQSVADLATTAMGCKREYLELGGLKEGDTVKLFNCHAFPSSTFEDYTHLQQIGKQIAKTVKGYPLVTKVVASHLRDNLTFEFWNNFLHQNLENFEGSDDDVMNVLKLSYYHIPTELQTCFRYCSIFPKHYKFKKHQLVEMWKSSGLISQASVRSQNLLDIGEHFLVQLTRKSFFDLNKHGYGPNAQVIEESEYYVMHDLMYDLAKHVSFGECARLVNVASLENVRSTVRHIFIEDINNFPVKNIKEISFPRNLRTIIIKNHYRLEINKDISNTVEELVEGSKSLRLFQTELGHTSQFLCKLAKLKHLRFVQLQSISPESIRGIVKLYHLTTLNCTGVRIELKQQRDIGNLDRLRYVTYGSNGFGRLPVGRLCSLLVLTDYYIQVEKHCKISALKDLRDLRSLGVKGLENVDNHEEAKEARLKEKQYLESLSLKWSERNGAPSMSDELILDNLEPHANLKELYISGFNGTRMPHWITKPSVKNLVKLEFKRCGNCEQLPVLDVVTLKHLMLQDLPMLKRIGQVSSVSEVECVDLILPPSLKTLVVIRCPELGELPVLPHSLVSLKIEVVGLTKLPRIGKHHEGGAETIAQLLDIRVENCQSLTSLEGSLFEQEPYMGVLRGIHIVNCVNLESAPLPFDEMNGLHEVTIDECPKLRTPRGAEYKLSPSLRCLTMQRCGDLELQLLGSLQRLTNLSYLWLQNCSIVESLPSADVFKSLKSLRYMKMTGCSNLSSLGGLGSLPFLDWLEIADCCKLAQAGLPINWYVTGGVVSASSLQINSLAIDLLSLLLVEPLHSLCQTKNLIVRVGSEADTLPERWLLQNSTSLKSLRIYKAKTLKSLPPSMRGLSYLENLILYDARKLGSLPDLPCSLKKLDIMGCPSELGNKFKEWGSPEWNKICHVPRVKIGSSFFIKGRECSENTFYRLSGADENTLISWENQQEENHKGVSLALKRWSSICCMGSAS